MVAVRTSRSRRSRPDRRTSSVCLALGLFVAGCTGSSTPPDGPPVYAGTTCAELAHEWGEEVDRRITTIIDGPDVVNGMAKDVPIAESYRGVMPFLVSDTLRTLLLLFFPAISLWLVKYIT